MADHADTKPVSGKTNLPFLSLGAAVVFVALAVVALIFVPKDDTRLTQVVLLVGLIVTTVPSLIASAFSERTSRDIRNGVMVAQVKHGATQALADHGVVTRDGPYVAASTQALLDLLAARHGDHQTEVEPTTPLTSEDIQ